MLEKQNDRSKHLKSTSLTFFSFPVNEWADLNLNKYLTFEKCTGLLESNRDRAIKPNIAILAFYNRMSFIPFSDGRCLLRIAWYFFHYLVRYNSQISYYTASE